MLTAMRSPKSGLGEDIFGGVPVAETGGVEFPGADIDSQSAAVMKQNRQRSASKTLASVFRTGPSVTRVWSASSNEDASVWRDTELKGNCWQRVFSSSWWLFTFLGLMMALASWTVDQVATTVAACSGAMIVLTDSRFTNFVAWLTFRLTMVLLSVGLVHRFAPRAAGSGIPEMKSILSGFDLFEYLGPGTGAVKIAALAIAVGTGLPIGREGPYVHIAGVCAHHMLTRMSRFESGLQNLGAENGL